MADDTNHNKTNDDESHLFRQEVAGAKPLRQHQATTNGKTDNQRHLSQTITEPTITEATITEPTITEPTMANDTNNNKTNDDESHLFRQEVAGAKPLPLRQRQRQATTNSKTDKISSFTKQVRQRAAITHPTQSSDGLSDTHIQPIEPEQTIEYIKAGLQHSRFKRLKQGRLSIDANLDLHGCTIEEARQSLTHFLSVCQNKNYRCVQVIHGKSHCSFGQQDTIKSYVNQWLPQIHSVQAFSSCLQRDGGSGAVYVLLKRRR
ncbi:MAG: Smr/MutS family protein [Endozoicomonadaceae bacterium]|nr:Smr/MutS family protein [Endozoicomonadaceae bacterium]